MADELSYGDIRDLLNSALNSGSSDYCWPNWIRDVFPSSVVYQDEMSCKLYKRDYSIDENNQVALGPAVEVIEKTSYEPVSITAPMSLAGAQASFSEDGEYVIRKGLIFRIGDYPDKRFSLTKEEAEAAVANFTPCPVDIEHISSPLDNMLGEVKAIALAENGEIYADVALPKWLDALFAGKELQVSSTWTREPEKKLVGLALVNNPRVPDAAIMSAFAAFSAGKKRNSVSQSQTQTQSHEGVVNSMTDTTTNNANAAGVNAVEAANAEFAAQLAAFKAQNEALQQRLALMEAEKRFNQAVAFADSQIQAHRLFPAEREELVALFAKLAEDDSKDGAQVTFSDGKQSSRVDRLKALVASRPSFDQLLTESVQVQDIEGAQTLFSRAGAANNSDNGQPTQEELDKVRNATALGKQAAARAAGK